MKFLLALVISVALALATSPLLFTEEASSPAVGLTEEERQILGVKPPPFTLETKDYDSEKMTQFKAALRLLNAYTVTMNQIRGCAASEQDAQAKKILSGFHSRNGVIMGRIMRLVEENGGLTPEIREKLDKRAAELMWADPRRGNCPAQLSHIADGGEDLYKAEKYAEDYKILRAKIE